MSYYGFGNVGGNENFDIFDIGGGKKGRGKGKKRKRKGTYDEIFDIAGIKEPPFVGFGKQKPMGDFAQPTKRKRRSKEAILLGIREDAENPILGLQFLGNAVGTSEKNLGSKRIRKKLSSDKSSLLNFGESFGIVQRDDSKVESNFNNLFTSDQKIAIIKKAGIRSGRAETFIDQNPNALLSDVEGRFGTVVKKRIKKAGARQRLARPKFGRIDVSARGEAVTDQFGQIIKTNRVEDTVVFGRALNPKIKNIIRGQRTKKGLKRTGRQTPSPLITPFSADIETQPQTFRQQLGSAISGRKGQRQKKGGTNFVGSSLPKSIFEVGSENQIARRPQRETRDIIDDVLEFQGLDPKTSVTDSTGDPLPTGIIPTEQLADFSQEVGKRKLQKKRLDKEMGKRTIQRIVRGDLIDQSQKQVLQKIKGSKTSSITGTPDPDRFDDNTLIIADGSKFKRIAVGEFKKEPKRVILSKEDEDNQSALGIFGELDRKRTKRESKQRIEPVFGFDSIKDSAPLGKQADTRIKRSKKKTSTVETSGFFGSIEEQNTTLGGASLIEASKKDETTSLFTSKIPQLSESKASPKDVQAKLKSIGAKPIVTNREVGGDDDDEIPESEFNLLGESDALPTEDSQDFFNKKKKGEREFNAIIDPQQLGLDKPDELSDLVFEDGKPVTIKREKELIEKRKSKGFDGTKNDTTNIFGIKSKSLADSPSDNFRVKTNDRGQVTTDNFGKKLTEEQKDKAGIIDDFGDIMDLAKNTGEKTKPAGFGLFGSQGGTQIRKGGDGIRVDSDARSSLDVKGFPILSIVNNIEKDDTNTPRMKISESEMSKSKFTQAIADGRITKSGLEEELVRADDRDTPKSTRNRRKKQIRRIISRFDEFKSRQGLPTPRSDRITGGLLISQDTKQKFEEDGDKAKFKENAFRENAIIPVEDLQGSSGFEAVVTQKSDKSGKGGIISALGKTKVGRLFRQRASDENKTIDEIESQDFKERMVIEDRERIDFEKGEREREKIDSDIRNKQFEKSLEEKRNKKIAEEEEEDEDEENDDVK